MHKQFYAILEKHNVILQNQFGFRKYNSTIYAQIQITEMMSKVSIDNGKYGKLPEGLFDFKPGAVRKYCKFFCMN